VEVVYLPRPLYPFRVNPLSFKGDGEGYIF